MWKRETNDECERKTMTFVFEISPVLMSPMRRPPLMTEADVDRGV